MSTLEISPYNPDAILIKRVINQAEFALKNDLGKNRSKSKWIEKTGNSGFLILLKQPYKTVKHVVNIFKDPRMVTITLTFTALLANSYLFYRKETILNLNNLSKYIIKELPNILKKYIPKQLQWSFKFTAYVYTSAIITSLGVRAFGRFSDKDLCSLFYNGKELNKETDNAHEM